MEQLVITVFTRNQPDTRILMDKAVYDMTEAKLLGRTPATIEQEGFEMRGDRMTFDSHSQTGHMVGNVKMTIFDVNQFASGGMLGAPTGTP